VGIEQFRTAVDTGDAIKIRHFPRDGALQYESASTGFRYFVRVEEHGHSVVKPIYPSAEGDTVPNIFFPKGFDPDSFNERLVTELNPDNDDAA